MMVKVKQMSENYTQKLLDEIRTGAFSNSNRLPPEKDLAEYFGVSRKLLRDCLSILESEGFISRKHGIGTIINQHVLDVKTRLDLEFEFMDLIRDTGREPSVGFLKHGTMQADSLIADQLKINIGDTVLFSKRIVCANLEPAIYCIDYISEKSVLDKNYDITYIDNPIFDFISKYCKTKIDIDLTQIEAVVADSFISEIFNIDIGSPILYLNEVGYNLNGKPILYSQEYYKKGMFNHTILRKKI